MVAARLYRWIIPRLGAIIPEMGSFEKRRGLGDGLFTKTQQRVIGLLFGNPKRSYYVNEIVRLAGGGTGAVRRELDRLYSVGLITQTRRGNQKHFQANGESPLFTELVSIVRKTFGLSDVLMQALATIDEHIELAFIYGSIAAGTDTAHSDVDLFLIVRDLTYADVMKALHDAEGILGRTVNPTLYSREELLRKLKASNSFLRRVLDQPKLFLIGSERELVV